VVKKLVEIQGGEVEASGEGLGRGSKFAIRLPALKEKLRSTIEKPRQAGETQSKRILVVDDSVDTAIGLARLLRVARHEVELAHDGHAAIENARAYLPEVLLRDIGLPGLNGYEVASMPYKEEGFKDSVFIAASGYRQEHDSERSRASGFNHHIAKPSILTCSLNSSQRRSPNSRVAAAYKEPRGLPWPSGLTRNAFVRDVTR